MKTAKIFTAFALIIIIAGDAFSQPITVVGQKSGFSGNSTLSIAQPTGLAAGDVMIAQLSMSGPNIDHFDPPSGWTLIRTLGGNGTLVTSLFYRVATSSDSSSYDFTDASGVPYPDKLGFIVAYRNVDTLNPVNAEAGVLTNGPTVATPFITTTADSCMIVAYYGLSSSSGFTFSGGSIIYSQGSLINYGVSEAASNFLQSTAGYIASQSASSNSIQASAELLALQKKGGGTVGMNEIKDNLHLNIYPNPVHDILTVSADLHNNVSLRLFTMTGEEVYSGYYSQFTETVMPIQLPAGIYILKLSNEERVITRKIVVQ